jgi:uncharacterized protein (DUF302 family)
MHKLVRKACSATLVALSLMLFTFDRGRAEEGDGIVRVRSAYPMAETVRRLREDIAAKGIRFFMEVDQAKLAADAGIALHPSTLLMFGNPPLGTQFMTSNPSAGLDWPVRLLVVQNADGDVWMLYTDFAWIARRHRISDRSTQFETATGVIASIIASAGKR